MKTKTIVFLLALWDTIKNELETREISPIVPDLFDLTKGRELDYPTVYQAFSEMSESYKDKLNLCGLSLGGLLALNYAIQYPKKINSLVLIGTPFEIPKGLLKFQNFVFKLMTKEYGDGANPVILKSEFIMSLCEQLIGGSNLGAKQKSIIDRCTASVYRTYQQNNYQGEVPTLQDFREELLKQDEPEAQEIALAIELFTSGSLNTFAKHTNVDTNNRLICYDILDLGKQLMPIGMLVVLDSILNRITQNRAKGRNTFIFIDEIYLLFQHEYSANFLFTLWKRVRKYGAYATGITQNVDDLLQSHTARTMLANSEFIIMLNQASTDRLELAKLLNISDLQMSYITNVEAGHGLIKVGSSLVPFANKFPKNTKLYKLMTTKPGESA